MLKKGIEQDSHTAHAVHPKAETSLALAQETIPASCLRERLQSKERNENFAGLQSEDASSDVSYFRFSSMHSSKERLGAEKSGWIR